MSKLNQPERIKTDSGAIRRVGFEIEFSGVGPETCVKTLQDLLGGKVVSESVFSKKLEDTEFGTFIVELDAALLTEEKYKDHLETLGIKLDELEDKEAIEVALKNVAETVVPCEVIMPPIKITEISVIEKIICLLRKEKAQGTGSSIFYAFGLHINTELASMQAEYLLNIIRAFALLYEWICVESKVDFSRRLSPYINPYPEDFLKHIFQDGYQPDINELIDDYLEFVPSRNHALDMLPAFASIDRERVMSRADEPDLIKPRPAFHYRLANCRIDEPEWSVADEWQYWLAIEKLADDEQKLNKIIGLWKEQSEQMLSLANTQWVNTVDLILKEQQ